MEKKNNNNSLKIVLFGPESTGKTELAQALAKHYQTSWVLEYARYYLENKFPEIINAESICAEEDILPIVSGQIALENAENQLNKNVVFLDTNPLETSVYVKYYFNKSYDWLEKIVSERHYDLYLLTDLSVAWQPDLLRDRPNDRENLFAIFKNELQIRNLPYKIITNIGEKRTNLAISIVDNFLLQKKM